MIHVCRRTGGVTVTFLCGRSISWVPGPDEQWIFETEEKRRPRATCPECLKEVKP